MAKKYDIPISDNSSKFKSRLDIMLDLVILRESLLNETGKKRKDDEISRSTSLLELQIIARKNNLAIDIGTYKNIKAKKDCMKN